MNTTESIVEGYFRQFRGCLTIADVKVPKGFGRQLDLLAFNAKTGDQYHIEICVKHDLSFCLNPKETRQLLQQKFFGAEKSLSNKVYLEAIKNTYKAYGFDFQKVIRVWSTWVIHDSQEPEKDVKAEFSRLAIKHGIKRPRFELLLFRDRLLPELFSSIGTQNYSDFNLRAISLVAMAEKQTKKRDGRIK
ncbi:hypothetical protein [Bdellovibrio sp. KM01]|uniref:hypothetical protein n=1 Tax=Bdellovibrio sp. KM01 TaxID=2748865 RepID=UPI0015E9AE45|nr:hypothetical protein [Bdellovibrio sp. KM01]QLY25696.1 hypothetical protein HW988_01185 [Bdellovibrio sp. KM01]